MHSRWRTLRDVATVTFSFALSVPSFGATTPRFAFVANAGDNTLSIYTVNATPGFLRDPSGAFLYVANSGSSNVSALGALRSGNSNSGSYLWRATTMVNQM
jgi:hypothetical protein